MRTYVILLLLLVATIASADTGFVFKGTIDKYPIEMEIWATAGSAVGSYYYLSQGKDKQLSLTGEVMLDVEAPVWIFKEDINNVHNGVFILRWDRLDNPTSEEVVGVYINVKGKSSHVKLRCIKTIPNPEHC